MSARITRYIGTLLVTLPLLVVGKTFQVPNFTAGEDVSMRNFEGNNLEAANFSGSDASGSSFINASLDYANLSLANFQNTNLTDVTFHYALIEFTDFTGAEGLTATQLSKACLTRADKEDKLGVEDFDTGSYVMPEECMIWEHTPRG